MAGDGSSPSVLESAGIEHANVLAAVTGEDEDNLVITTLGRFEFGVPRIIARVNNPKNVWLFTPEMGVDVALSQSDILAKLIAEEMSLGDMMTLLKLRKGEFSIVEEKWIQGQWWWVKCCAILIYLPNAFLRQSSARVSSSYRMETPSWRQWMR